MERLNPNRVIPRKAIEPCRVSIGDIEDAIANPRGPMVKKNTTAQNLDIASKFLRKTFAIFGQLLDMCRAL